MKAVQVLRHGRPTEAIEITDIAVPHVGPGEVRIAVSAASLNFGDIARSRGGVAAMMFPPPLTLGMDVCGIVEAAGEGAEQWIGRRVVAMTRMAFGGMAQFAIAPAASVFDAPPQFDDAEAAGFLLPFHVSYLGLQVRAKLQAGESVLVTGAASGVGSATIQLAATAGGQVIALAGGAEKGRACLNLGANHFIDHQVDDLFERVMTITEGRGADVVFDLVGGELTDALWSCVAREGRYLPIGFNGDAEGGFTGRPLRKVAMANFSVLGVMLSYAPPNPMIRRMGLNPFPPETGQQVHVALCDLIAAGKIKPLIGRRIAMEEVATALEDHEARKTMGRTIVLIPGA
ncbi:oxidoreductase [Sphingomonas sp. DBB INV C78]|uniref:quinone oxidoreductase family protein n=1 Tax=Sphingomonas sp. DBB INV C78 TaxID=3349434 RepID=UPI0036D2B38A